VSLTELCPGFDVRKFEALRQSRVLGMNLELCEETGSTNDDLMRRVAEGIPHGLVRVSEHQTRGRGRASNLWLSPRPRENLLFSVHLRPRFAMDQLSAFTLAVGLSVRRAIGARVSLPAGVKWINDVMVDDRKIAGILIESQLLPRGEVALVVGIGVNVLMTELPEPIRGLATSLQLLGATRTEREPLLADILSDLEVRVSRWEDEGVASVLDELRQHDAIRGRRVRIDGRIGVARGIDASGGLRFEPEGSSGVEVLTHGLVELLVE